MSSIDDVSFRPFHPEDAEGVNGLFREAYGPSYPYKAATVVPAGAYFVVALSACGRVIGFARSRWLEAEGDHAPYPNVHELGGYVVSEAYRRLGIGERLSRLCEEAARADRGEIHISHSEPVSWGNGLASQRIFQKHGFRILGFSALKYPDISADWHGEQPASMTIVARRAGRNGNFVQCPRHIPAPYEEFVRSLMEGCPISHETRHSAFPMPSVVTHKPVEAKGAVGAEIVDVPANWQEARPVVESLQRNGYLFSAFLPEHGGIKDEGGLVRFDYLRLYRPPASYRTRCDWDLIQVVSAGSQIKRFLAEEHVRSIR
jgi:ribosomal protein S18 acetylase RimI-like enzyme